jgi:hypothetical protein
VSRALWRHAFTRRFSRSAAPTLDAHSSIQPGGFIQIADKSYQVTPTTDVFQMDQIGGQRGSPLH